jgi:hypothetical protein
MFALGVVSVQFCVVNPTAETYILDLLLLAAAGLTVCSATREREEKKTR